jgi:hypothetical protein
MNDSEIKGILGENRRRMRELNRPYNQYLGIGSPIPRFELRLTNNESLHLPIHMKEESFIRELLGYFSVEGWARDKTPDKEVRKQLFQIALDGITQLRFSYDFEFWAITCVKIQDKESDGIVPFRLRRPQRKLLQKLEECRVAGEPIRIILLKARQWGGSTEIQIYMAWIQLLLKKNWHSTIVADVENQAKNIKFMYSRLIQHHPKSVCKATFSPFEGSMKNKIIEERGCVISIGSMREPESLRSSDIRMAHLSEVGSWKETEGKKPEDVIQTIAGSVHTMPYTMIVMESTAKGVGNFFHRQWQDAESGKSRYHGVFIGWFEIEMYSKPIDNKEYEGFIKKMSEHDWFMWEAGASLEGINWYNWKKTTENYDDWRMASEFPTTAAEAFQSTGRRAFAPTYVARLRKTCIEPLLKGEIYADSNSGKEALKNIHIEASANGLMSVWQHPDTEIKMPDRYLVAVDIGGRTIQADFSVIRVIDRYWMAQGGVPELVLTWRGHLDQDLVIWKAVMIAKLYNEGLIIPESNSLDIKDSEGDHILTILDEIVDYYPNIYCRTDPERIRQGAPVRYGFHTNIKSKVAAIDNLNALMRESGYLEYDRRVVDEYDYYEIKPNGSYGAVDGQHDDLVMATAIGLKVCMQMEPPREVKKRPGGRVTRKIVSEASF